MLSKEYLPGLRDRIIARSVQSPLDYERRIISAVHGTHQHGAFLPYQIGAMRPIPEFGSYSYQSATFISAAPAVTLAPASRWRPGAMPPRSSAAILASLSLATVRRNRIRRHPLPELLYRPLQRAGRARHDALLACALLHQAISAPKLWNPQGWQIVADGGSDRLLSLFPSSM